MCKRPHVPLPRLSLSHGQSSLTGVSTSCGASFFYNVYNFLQWWFEKFHNSSTIYLRGWQRLALLFGPRLEIHARSTVLLSGLGCLCLTGRHLRRKVFTSKNQQEFSKIWIQKNRCYVLANFSWVVELFYSVRIFQNFIIPRITQKFKIDYRQRK